MLLRLPVLAPALALLRSLWATTNARVLVHFSQPLVTHSTLQMLWGLSYRHHSRRVNQELLASLKQKVEGSSKHSWEMHENKKCSRVEDLFSV